VHQARISPSRQLHTQPATALPLQLTTPSANRHRQAITVIGRRRIRTCTAKAVAIRIAVFPIVLRTLTAEIPRRRII
jgi:hypothetical protein